MRRRTSCIAAFAAGCRTGRRRTRPHSAASWRPCGPRAAPRPPARQDRGRPSSPFPGSDRATWRRMPPTAARAPPLCRAGAASRRPRSTPQGPASARGPGSRPAPARHGHRHGRAPPPAGGEAGRFPIVRRARRGRARRRVRRPASEDRSRSLATSSPTSIARVDRECRTQAAQCHPGLVQRLLPPTLEQQRLVQPILAQAGAGDMLEGFRRGHRAVQRDRLCLDRLDQRPAQPITALGLGQHADPDGRDGVDPAGDREQRGGIATLQFEFDLAHGGSAIAGQDVATVQDQLDPGVALRMSQLCRSTRTSKTGAIASAFPASAIRTGVESSRTGLSFFTPRSHSDRANRPAAPARPALIVWIRFPARTADAKRQAGLGQPVIGRVEIDRSLFRPFRLAREERGRFHADRRRRASAPA